MQGRRAYIPKIYPNTCEADGKVRSLKLDGRKIALDEVIDHWQEGEKEYVKLRADDERIYFLKHGEDNHRVYLLHLLSHRGKHCK
jgi:hypothetical protein